MFMMRSIKRRSIFHKISTSNTFIVFLIILAIFFIRVALKSKDRLVNNQKKMDEINKEYKERKDYEIEISKKVDFLSTDEGAQSVLRSKFLGIKEGEAVAVIVKDENSPELKSSSTPQKIKSSFWKRLADLLPF